MRQYILLTVWAVLFCTFANSAVIPSPIVKTDKGPIQGEILKTVWHNKLFSSFKGIPYGSPPIGNKRFKPSVETESWTNVVQTTVEGSPCMQLDPFKRTAMGSEDCLFLNVYTPKTDLSSTTNDLPVMVWIHPGFYAAGWSNSSLYGPDFFIEDDVILVTLNFRVGAFGFLSLNHSDATGNAGLKDVNLALKWIQKNIANFGGNPKNVTLFGTGTGGAMVDLLMVSDASVGLFHKTISMSASLLCPWAIYPQEVAMKRAFSLGAALGYKDKTAKELLDLLYQESAEKILASSFTSTMLDVPWKPTIENPSLAKKEDLFLTECAMRKYVTGNFSHVPHIMGYMENEGLYYATKGRLERISKIDPKDLDATKEGFADFIGAYSLVGGIDTKQRILKKYTTEPIYYYRITYDSPYALHNSLFHLNVSGATHFDDIGYLFNTPIAPEVPTDPSNPLSVFRQKMVRLWTNFAKFGNPTPAHQTDDILDVTWEPIGNEEKQLEINKSFKMGPAKVKPLARWFEMIIKANAEVTTGCSNTPHFPLEMPFMNA